MPSRLGWVDFAEEDRQRMLNVVRLLGEPGTLDEMGIGRVRDAFADFFFPGTSTIQTRAKYFLFIPWTYQVLERRRISSQKIGRRVHGMEVRLIEALLKRDDTDGLIGQDARGNLQRMPSAIYWNGLGVWGTRLSQGSQSQHHAYLDSFYRRKETLESLEVLGKEYDADDRVPAANWHPGLPEPPEGFPDSAELRLTPKEAAYLAERIRIKHGGSLLAEVLKYGHDVEIDFVWQHPLLARLPAELRKTVVHAQNFSEAVNGSALLYNLMLTRKLSSKEETGDYGERFREWWEMLSQRWEELQRWHAELGAFWDCPALKMANVPAGTRMFVSDWFNLTFAAAGPDELAADRQAQELIEFRERVLKGSRARLQNQRALENWRGDSGTARLNYRWANVRRIMRDIFDGLAGGEAAHV